MIHMCSVVVGESEQCFAANFSILQPSYEATHWERGQFLFHIYITSFHSSWEDMNSIY